MKRIPKQDSDETETRQCSCKQRDSKENRHTKEQNRNRTSMRQGKDSNNSDNSMQQIRLLGHFQASHKCKLSPDEIRS